MNNPDDWDDTLILQIFHDSITKHRTRDQEANGKGKLTSSLSEQKEENTEDNQTGKRKRLERESKSQTLKGMMDSYYSSRTRQDLANTNLHTHPYKKKEQTVRFDIPQNLSEPENISTNEYPFRTEPDQNSSLPQPPTLHNPILNDALQNMLMAWYQSGYATGRYQTLLEFSHLLPNHYTESSLEDSTQNNTSYHESFQ